MASLRKSIEYEYMTTDIYMNSEIFVFKSSRGFMQGTIKLLFRNGLSLGADNKYIVR